MTNEQIVLYGLLGLGVVTLAWSLYAAGKANQRVKKAQEELSEAIAIEEANNELERQSREAANRAVDAGLSAGPAPDDPERLPDSVRARIFRRGG